MKFIFQTYEKKEDFLPFLEDNRRVNEGVKFSSLGTPTVKMRRLFGDFWRVRCLLVGGPAKDNGFVEGTFFLGKIKENGGTVKVRGIILTEPVFHLVFTAGIAALVVLMVKNKGVNVLPFCLVPFVIFMMKNEYKKQGMLKRYFFRAMKRTAKEK